MVLLASACGGSVDPTTVDLEGEWDVLITNVQHFELTCRINFSMQLREIESPNSYDGEIPRDTGIRCPNGFIYPLDRELSNLVFEPDGENLKVTVGGRPFAVVELQSENEMKGDVNEGYFPGARFSARR
jgi:hypothetical protein